MGQHVIFPGSFDPVTLGHLDLIERGARLFERVTVVSGVNAAKQTLFTAEERLQQVRELVAHLANVEVVVLENRLMADYAREQQVSALLRGVRNTTDFEYEALMAQANRMLVPNLDTVVLLANPQLQHISSSLVKEIARYQGDIQQLVPASIQAAVERKFR